MSANLADEKTKAVNAAMGDVKKVFEGLANDVSEASWSAKEKEYEKEIEDFINELERITRGRDPEVVKNILVAFIETYRLRGGKLEDGQENPSLSDLLSRANF